MKTFILLSIVAISLIPSSTGASTCIPGSRTINGRQCRIECDVDHPGGDYKSQRSGSFEACVQACAADSRCVTAQYHKNNGYCYLKGVLNKAKANANDDTVICGAAITTTTITTTSTTTTTTPRSEPSFIPCTGPYGNEGGTGSGGCPITCFCDHAVGAGPEAGFCEAGNICERSCDTDADCPSGQKCTDSYRGDCPGGGNTCVDPGTCNPNCVGRACEGGK